MNKYTDLISKYPDLQGRPELAHIVERLAQLERENSDLEKRLNKSEQRNAKKDKEMSALRRLNHTINASLTAAENKLEASDKKIKQLETHVENYKSIYINFIHALIAANISYFGFLKDKANLDLGKVNYGLLQNKLNEIVASFKSLDTALICNTRAALNLSKSEKSTGYSPQLELDNGSDSDNNNEDVLPNETWNKSKEEQDKQLDKILNESSHPITEFAHNCDLVRKLRNDLCDSHLGAKLKAFTEQRDNCANKQDDLLVVGMQELLDFADTFILPKCPHKNAIDYDSIKPNTSLDTKDIGSKKAQRIKDSNLVLRIPKDGVIKRQCPHCNSLCEHKAIETKEFRVLNAIQEKVLFPKYEVKCCECHTSSTVTLIDLIADKEVLQSCTSYGKEDQLYLPHEDALRRVYEVINNSQYDADKAKEALLQAFNQFIEATVKVFDYQAAANKIDSLPKEKQAQEVRKQSKNRVEDIQRQPHTKTTMNSDNGLSDASVDFISLLASTPVFKGSKFTTSIFANLSAGQAGYNSKSCFHKNALSHGIEQAISRSSLMTKDIAFTRAYFHGVANQIRQQILQEAQAVHFDESPVSVVGLSKTSGSSHKGWLWGMASAITSETPMVYIEACKTREASNFLQLIDYNSELAQFKYAIMDGYVGYQSAFKRMQGEPKTFACCWAHFRRSLHQYLQNTDNGKLLKLYSSKLLPKRNDVSCFIPNLRKQCLEKGAVNTEECLILLMYYTINMIFANDAKVIDAHDNHSQPNFLNELEQMRSNNSAHLVAALDLLVGLYIAMHNNIVLSSKGKTFVVNSFPSKVNSFCLYWMKLRNNLIEFINSPHIALSNNIIEQAFKLPAILKHVSLSQKTMDGFCNFADRMTILENCALCGAPVFDYVVWLVSQVQARINQLSQSEIQDDLERAQANFPLNKVNMVKNRAPNKFDFIKTIDKEGNEDIEKIDIYDDRNPTVALYDRISYAGLTPQDFMKLIKNR